MTAGSPFQCGPNPCWWICREQTVPCLTYRGFVFDVNSYQPDPSWSVDNGSFVVGAAGSDSIVAASAIPAEASLSVPSATAWGGIAAAIFVFDFNAGNQATFRICQADATHYLACNINRLAGFDLWTLNLVENVGAGEVLLKTTVLRDQTADPWWYLEVQYHQETNQLQLFFRQGQGSLGFTEQGTRLAVVPTTPTGRDISVKLEDANTWIGNNPVPRKSFDFYEAVTYCNPPETCEITTEMMRGGGAPLSNWNTLSGSYAIVADRLESSAVVMVCDTVATWPAWEYWDIVAKAGADLTSAYDLRVWLAADGNLAAGYWAEAQQNDLGQVRWRIGVDSTELAATTYAPGVVVDPFRVVSGPAGIEISIVSGGSWVVVLSYNGSVTPAGNRCGLEIASPANTVYVDELLVQESPNPLNSASCQAHDTPP